MNDLFGHRTLEALRAKIEKIKFVTNRLRLSSFFYIHP